MSDITATTVFTRQQQQGRRGLSSDQGGWLVKYDDAQNSWSLVDKVDLRGDLGNDELAAHYGVYLAPRTGLFHTHPNTANPPETIQAKRIERFATNEQTVQELAVWDAAPGVEVHYGHLENATLAHDSGPGQVTLTEGWKVDRKEFEGPFIGTIGYARLSGLRDGQRFKSGGPY